MGEVVLSVQGISKRYARGVRNSATLKQSVRKWLQRAKSGEQKSDNYIWALKDVSFELKKGDVAGFLGSNGAGKSTLLKIISKIVIPTEGRIEGTGRVGSLLEVGTGFHGELTGRENIFLNGTILGMSKREVAARFDQIVDFSGIEAFLDTPVKRYSSGMYMRLAFAVAVHMDSDILILDEVLAVGDLEFQQKCLNKIKEVASREGRTIMFVSHNIQSVRSLCNRALFLKEGRVEKFGATDHVINSYITKSNAYVREQDFTGIIAPPGNEHIRIQRVALNPCQSDSSKNIPRVSDILLSVEFAFIGQNRAGLNVEFRVFNFAGDYLFNISSDQPAISRGRFLATSVVPGNFLNPGSYYISICFLNNNTTTFEFSKCLSFYVDDKPNGIKYSAPQGIITPHFKVKLQPM